MKVLYATDLHGQIPKFECIKRIISDHDILILGADLLPKGLGATDKKINDFIFRYLPDFFQHLYDIPIIVDFGNDDWLLYYDYFKKVISAYNNVYTTHMVCQEIGGYKFCGMNYVPDYPFNIKDWCRRDGKKIVDSEQIGNPFTSVNGFKEPIGDLKRFISDVPTIMEELNYLPKPTDKTIYLIHAPPYQSRLDVCRKRVMTLDKDDELGWKLVNVPVGSVDVKAWIQKEKPWLTLHGHIHESFELTGVCINRVKDTICINPGQKGGGGKTQKLFVWCEFNLEDVEGTFTRKEMKE